MPRISCWVRFVSAIGLWLALACTISPAQTAATPAQNDPDRQRALELFGQGKFVDAMPLFEKLSADHPSDAGVREGWAWCLFHYAATLSDPEQRKKVRAQAHTVGLQAKQLGDNSQLLQVILELPEDGSEVVFSNRTEVEEAMRAGEAAFARGEFDQARESYLRALLLDPDNYNAALFIGDVYFKQHVYGTAGEWFSRAIQINPNRETAYRYWGDALIAMGKDDDARAKYIEAIVAEPYSQHSWVGLTNWLQRHKLQTKTLRLPELASVTTKDDKNFQLTLSNTLKGDANILALTTYGISRASWRGDKFKKEFPNEPKYRHSLREESESFALMVTVLKEQKDYSMKLLELDPMLQEVIKIQEAGLLDPYVLLNQADEDISQDYEPYRSANRDKIQLYLDTFVVPKWTQPGASDSPK